MRYVKVLLAKSTKISSLLGGWSLVKGIKSTTIPTLAAS